MEFAGFDFLIYFLPFFFLIYVLVPNKLKNIVLLVGSFIFCLLGNKADLPVLLASILMNYLAGIWYGREEKRHGVWLPIAGNLALLAWFKIKGGAIPLGLSFYTFQAISYLVDVSQKRVAPEQNIERFSLYMGMFPKVASGPLVTYGKLRESLMNTKLTGEGFQKGLQLFVFGLAAKVLLADRLHVLWHDLEVAGYESVTWRYAWIGAFAFSLKLYFDFYGYSLMAIGLGRMLGFTLPDNFKTPYLSRSVREFYRRWHITLGAWFRDYVYIPLGGNRKGASRMILHLLVVWFLTGLWHGLSLNFILWGLFLWLCIVMERGVEKLSFVKKMRILPHLYLWFVIPISWMLFAITDISQLGIYLCRMFGIGEVINGNIMDWRLALERHGVILAVSVFCASGLVEKLYEKKEKSFLLNFLLAALFWICVYKIMRQGSNPFLYVNF